MYKLYEKGINSDTFKEWVTVTLLPEAPTHSVFILDNASFHKRNDIQESIISAGHTLLFQPTYSPDLYLSSPPEKKGSQLKEIESLPISSFFVF